MGESDKEAIYDAEVAPALLEVSKTCQRHGMSMVVAVEYDENAIGQTNCLQPMRGYWISLIDFAARAKGNVDTLILGLMRHAREHGHSSAMMDLLGVPTTPGTEGPRRRAYEERWLTWTKRPGDTMGRYEARLRTRVVGEIVRDGEAYAWRGTLHDDAGRVEGLPEAKVAFETSLRAWLESFRPFMDTLPPGHPGRDEHPGLARRPKGVPDLRLVSGSDGESHGSLTLPEPSSPAREFACLPMAELHGSAFARIVAGSPGALVIDARPFPYFDLTDLGRVRAFRLMDEAPVRYLHAAIDLKPAAGTAERWRVQGEIRESLAAAVGEHAGPVIVLLHASAEIDTLDAALRVGRTGDLDWKARTAVI